MEEIIYEVDEIFFGVYSAEEIKKFSVSEITSSKLSGEKNDEGTVTPYNTVYDPRMGVLENSKTCETCNQDLWACPGHFGHIQLNESICHPLFYKNIIQFLKCFCINCYRSLFSQDQLLLSGYNKIKGFKRFEMILKKLEKIDICNNCLHPQPEIKYSPIDSQITMIYKKKKEKIVSVISAEEIKKIFQNVSNEDISILGFDANFVHPKNLIMTFFPVIPPSCRPYVMTEGNICDDDLTNQLIEIIKTNNHLNPTRDNPLVESERKKYVQSLKFKILTFFNNCLEPSTPVLTWNGIIKPAKDITTQDTLIGDDGTPRAVLSTCSGTDEMFEIIKANGESYTVNSNHILTLKFKDHKVLKWSYTDKTRKMGCWWYRYFCEKTMSIQTEMITIPSNEKFSNPKIIEIFNKREKIPDTDLFDISVKKYLELSVSAQKLLLDCKLHFTHVKWPKSNVKLDPYILGSWLAIGSHDTQTLVNPRINIVSKWKTWCYDNRHEMYIRTIIGDFVTYNIAKKYSIFECILPNFLKSQSLTSILYEIDVVENKRIPMEYIVNDKQTRMNLLAGYIDSCGVFDKRNVNCCYIQCLSPTLKKDIMFLLSTLGYMSTEVRTGIYFYIHNSEELNITGKKYSRLQNVNAFINDMFLPIKVVSKGTGKYVGFTVDCNNRFLLGDFTITHNSGGKAKHTINGRPIKGLKERITGKDGVIRTNLMGKRVNQSGRTVIGPDPTLRVDELAIPPEFATNLTVPVRVAAFNFNFMQKIVNEGKANYVTTNNGKTTINLNNAIFYKGTNLTHGDIIIRKNKDNTTSEIVVLDGKTRLQEGDQVKRNGEILQDIKYPCRREYKLKIGDIVDRKLMDGDIVLLNRQPTLHKGSMIAKKVIIRPGKTLRMNLAITKSFNADQ